MKKTAFAITVLFLFPLVHADFTTTCFNQNYGLGQHEMYCNVTNTGPSTQQKAFATLFNSTTILDYQNYNHQYGEHLHYCSEKTDTDGSDPNDCIWYNTTDDCNVPWNDTGGTYQCPDDNRTHKCNTLYRSKGIDNARCQYAAFDDIERLYYYWTWEKVPTNYTEYDNRYFKGNQIPFSSGETKEFRLKWKTPVVNAGSSGIWSINPQGGWNTSWGYYKQLNLTNNGAGVLQENYTFSFRVNLTDLNQSGKALLNGNDFRVTYYNSTTDTETELDRKLIIGNGTSNNRTICYVQVQANISAGATDGNYTIYYGNPTAGTPPEDVSEIWVHGDSQVANYPMNNPPERNSSYVYDIIGNNHGQIIGATNTTGFDKEGLSFDGTDDYVSIHDVDELSFTDGSNNDKPFSFVTWIKMDDASNFKILIKADNAGNDEYQFHTTASDKLYFHMHDDSAGGYIGRYYNTPLTPYEGQWIMVAGTYDGSESSSGIDIYLNGQVVDDTNFNFGSYAGMENGNQNILIGRRGYDSSYANGTIAEVRIYNWSLSPIEVSQLYVSTAPTVTLGAEQGVTPTITIHSPANTTYTTTSVDLNVSSPDTIDTWWYSIDDNGTNVTFTPNTTINNLSEGQHNLTVYANDTTGNIGNTTVFFTIDTEFPIITVHSPQNTTYNQTQIDLNVTAENGIDTWWYSLNGGANTTFIPNSTITVSWGQQYNITVYANDSANNINSSTVYFTVSPSPEATTSFIVIRWDVYNPKECLNTSCYITIEILGGNSTWMNYTICNEDTGLCGNETVICTNCTGSQILLDPATITTGQAYNITIDTGMGTKGPVDFWVVGENGLNTPANIWNHSTRNITGGNTDNYFDKELGGDIMEQMPIALLILMTFGLMAISEWRRDRFLYLFATVPAFILAYYTGFWGTHNPLGAAGNQLDEMWTVFCLFLTAYMIGRVLWGEWDETNYIVKKEYEGLD